MLNLEICSLAHCFTMSRNDLIMLQCLDLEDWVEFFLVEASIQALSHRGKLLEKPVHDI